MERREHGGDTHRGAPAGAADTGMQESAAGARGTKHESGSARSAAGQAAMAEENWSALSNLRVAGETESGEEATVQTQPGSTRSSAGSSSRHKVRRTSSQVHPTTPQDDEAFLHELDAVSKSSLSFILDDQAASAAAGKADDGQAVAAVASKARTASAAPGDRLAAFASMKDASSMWVANVAQLQDAPVEQNIKGVAGDTVSSYIIRLAAGYTERRCLIANLVVYSVRGQVVRLSARFRAASTVPSRAAFVGRTAAALSARTMTAKRLPSRTDCAGLTVEVRLTVFARIVGVPGFQRLCVTTVAGKRCAVEGCMRQAYERTDNLCNNHYQERQQGGAATATEEPGEHVAASSLHPDDDEEKPPAPPSDH
ncbi:unnamed protein product [Phytophthora fragariaefolia]|uniref:Unnamed protein product n=1 Tax=Phytophthora fragariaefolia TaxID=1490495 RepID=A0A9W6XVS6_9STRA|nr:unnamed protein product [Phytophthora fragariaefolia]